MYNEPAQRRTKPTDLKSYHQLKRRETKFKETIYSIMLNKMLSANMRSGKPKRGTWGGEEGRYQVGGGRRTPERPPTPRTPSQAQALGLYHPCFVLGKR
jgi:hypothetical protein